MVTHLQECMYHYKGPIYQGQFHLGCHGTCGDEKQLKDFLKSPLNMWEIPAKTTTKKKILRCRHRNHKRVKILLKKS